LSAASGQTVTYNGTGTTGMGGIVGTAGLTLGVATTGTGTIVLGGNNNYFTGGFTVNAGTVRLANASALNSVTPQAVTMANTAVLQLNGNSITTSSLTGASGNVLENGNSSATAVTLTVNQSGGSAFAGTIQNGTGAAALSLVKTGAGALTLSGTNTYSGGTTINGGSIVANADGNLGTGGSVTLSSGTLTTSGITSSRSIFLGGAGSTGGTISSSGTSTLSGVIANATGFTGALSLSAPAGAQPRFSAPGAPTTLTPEQQAARAIYKEMVEINTKLNELAQKGEE
jgi:fibronectin-binding autotransporter adhesin